MVIKNKWVKVILILLVEIVVFFGSSYFLMRFGFSESSGVLGNFINTIIRFGLSLMAVLFSVMFLFQKSFKDILYLFGIKKKYSLRSVLIGSLFFIASAVLFLIILTIYAVVHFGIPITELPSFFVGYFSEMSLINTVFINFEFSYIFLVGVVIQIFSAFQEEIVTRAFVINVLSPKNKRRSLVFAILISSLFFSFFHIMHPISENFSFFQSFIYLSQKFISGVLYSTCFILSKRNILGVGIYHSLLNLTSLNPFLIIYGFFGIY